MLCLKRRQLCLFIEHLTNCYLDQRSQGKEGNDLCWQKGKHQTFKTFCLLSTIIYIVPTGVVKLWWKHNIYYFIVLWSTAASEASKYFWSEPPFTGSLTKWCHEIHYWLVFHIWGVQKHFNQLVCASQIPSIAPSHFSARPFSFRVAGSLAGITNHDGIAPRRPKPAKTNIINMVCFSTKAFEITLKDP